MNPPSSSGEGFGPCAAHTMVPHRAARIYIFVILGVIGITVAIVGVSIAIHRMIVVSKKRAAHSTFLDLPLLTYHLDTGSFPTTKQGLQALIVQPEGIVGWKGPYLNAPLPLVDPWHHDYHYVFPGTHNPKGYDVWSDGPDGVSGTSDDIGNWENPVTTQ